MTNYDDVLLKDEGTSEIKAPKLGIYEKELILRMAQDHDCLQDYNDWIAMMAAFKHSGFSVEDFKRISWQDPKTQKDIDYKWDGVDRLDVSFGSIVYKIAPQWTNLSWRFEKVEDVAIDMVIKWFSHLHKVLVGKDVCVIDENTKDKGVLRDRKNTFDCYRGKEYKVWFPSGIDREKKEITYKKMNGFQIWFDNAPICQGVVCNPDKPFGEIEQDGELVFNDWEEAEPTPLGEGSTEPFWQHIKENVCDGNEECFNYFQMWIYDLLANPLHRNGIAIAVSGDQGCGKSIIGNILSLCFDKKYVSTINNSAALQDRFDAAWKNSILVMLEESTFAGDRKSGVWSKMKDLITSEITTVERKGIDVQHIQNKLHFLITSNDEFVVPKQKSDRRYLVLRCNNNKRCDRKFFSSLTWNMKNGGAYKLIQEAKEHKKEAMEFNYMNMPQTEIGAENMLESSPPLMRYLISCIEEYIPDTKYEWGAFWDDKGEIIINASSLMEHYQDQSNSKFDGLLNARRVGRWIAQWTGKESVQRKVMDEYSIPNERNVKCFVFGSLNELKSSVSEHYFGGMNPFTEGDVA